jgi:hypothetical protein
MPGYLKDKGSLLIPRLCLSFEVFFSWLLAVITEIVKNVSRLLSACRH